jgi:hypothetical protein
METMNTLVNKNGFEDLIALFEKIKMTTVKKMKKEISR